MYNNKSRKRIRNVPFAIVHINASFNNTTVTFTDMNGDTLVCTTGGQTGCRGSRKATPYTAQSIVNKATTLVNEYGVKTINIKVRGPGQQRDAAIRALADRGFIICNIEDVSPVPYNGTRPPKKRRN